MDAAARAWVDSVLASLDVRRKAAQLVFPWMWGRYVPTGDAEWAMLRARVEDA
ncbi:MAG: hypothetical protein GWM90_02700, partial [Gemmatimonadetes bacterium]|nr:hypothetical protein [Gemmatimonadota bacterium]NIQ59096.1 hypothetical protein [Gemmatimonadota bacterium]NIU79299.1 hypothetical protein [Gammaproteobacteria bacterium]NIX43074.1 hypothetical protein [Gemmatimonadota bacterium]NIY12350.1 hypothetical protein [Gemmatimonadota bacterium]